MANQKPGSWQPPSGPYAGDIEPAAAWALLRDTPEAILVDVRTGIERTLIGEPDLRGIGREAVRLEWQTIRGTNPDFGAQLRVALEALGARPPTPLLFLCRSGGRSRAAAIEATALGFEAAWNIAHGFEGDLDADAHRNRLNGWRAAGLPWVQT